MVTLHPFSPADFPKLISWIDSEEALVQFAGPIFRFPLTNAQLQQHLDNPRLQAFNIIDAETSEQLGHAGLFRAQDDSFRLCTLLIGNPDYRGQGLGHQIVEELLQRAFAEAGIAQADLNVFDWNTAAIRCYEKAGFRLNPKKSSRIDVRGRIWKCLNMVLTRSEWEARVPASLAEERS